MACLKAHVKRASGLVRIVTSATRAGMQEEPLPCSFPCLMKKHMHGIVVSRLNFVLLVLIF